MPIFGITASSNMSTKLTDFYQIATTTLGSAQSSITFSSIPQTYTHLQIRGIAKSTATDDTWMQVNSDTATNYSWHALRGSGGAASSFGGASANKMWTGYGMSDTGIFRSSIIDILDYTNTNKFKTFRTYSGCDTNTSTGWIEFISGNWRSTSAVTSITLFPNSGNYGQYSSFQLYGVKA
jgi:hypothetical protein